MFWGQQFTLLTKVCDSWALHSKIEVTCLTFSDLKNYLKAKLLLWKWKKIEILQQVHQAELPSGMSIEYDPGNMSLRYIRQYTWDSCGLTFPRTFFYFTFQARRQPKFAASTLTFTAMTTFWEYSETSRVQPLRLATVCLLATRSTTILSSTRRTSKTMAKEKMQRGRLCRFTSLMKSSSFWNVTQALELSRCFQTLADCLDSSSELPSCRLLSCFTFLLSDSSITCGGEHSKKFRMSRTPIQSRVTAWANSISWHNTHPPSTIYKVKQALSTHWNRFDALITVDSMSRPVIMCWCHA